MRRLIYIFTVVLLWVAASTSCRGEEHIVPSTSNQVYDYEQVGDIKGFFLLNEGNMGSNKATIDYLDYPSGVYSKNIYAERNPNVTKELGDVGNDIQIYKDRIYAVINNSNLIEVMDCDSAEQVGVVSVPNCRYIAFDGAYAYVTSYAGAVESDANYRLGYVAKIDLESLEVVAECSVGYQPEELVVVGQKLYVANSGGYCAPDYDNRLSVIDLESFEEIEKIEIEINLHRLELDSYGCLWISSRGDYYDTPSKTYVLNTQNHEVTELDLPNSNMALMGDMLYVASYEWNYSSGEQPIAYSVVDTKTQAVIDSNFIKDGTESAIVAPYGLAVNAETEEIFVTDATNYVTPGKLYCYSLSGQLKWSVTTGDVPSSIVFTTTQLQSIQ
ncbi:MAG: YncE family protein [Rikenellaceae bacterium]